MFENKQFEGIYYSRFVASWFKHGKGNWRKFRRWLRTLTVNGKPIPADVEQEIYDFATNGKLELEQSIDRFLEG